MVAHRTQNLLIVLCMICVWNVPALAGPPAICVKAASSGNGNFLVITQTQFEPGGPNMSRTAREVTLEVFPNEAFIGLKDVVATPARYWTDWVQWSVVLNSSNMRPLSPCPLALVTDDGGFLILVGTDADSWALQIYRRRDHPGDPLREGRDHGVFIRAIPLKELWPAEKLRESESVMIRTDETPQWFAGGNFSFSPDSRQLIYKTQWRTAVRINLADGSVSKQ